MRKFKNVYLKFGDAKKMSFPDHYFDYVVCMANTFGNWEEDKLKILREMKRATKIGGKIIVSVYNDKAKTFDIRLISYRKLKFSIRRLVPKEKKIYIEVGGRKGVILTEQFSKMQL